tara:strand:+ start:519 stop:1196 length:678 start_codon:yes stop_codon:yes gene_type:complete
MNWIEKSASKGKALRRQYSLRDIEIFIKDKLPDEVDPDFVFKYVASVLPEHFLINIDIIYIGQFENLISRNVRGIFEDGAIYITNEQDTEMDFVDDLIHEIAHSIEHTHKDIIYGSGAVEEEFRKKRSELYTILKQKGYSPPVSMNSEINYSQEIDDYLYKEVGYPILQQIAVMANLFIGSYASTSIREYFATGFEAYFMGEKDLVRDYSPALHRVLQELENLGG